MTNNDLKQLAQQFGGKFHGPNIEHLSIPETQFFELAQHLVTLGKPASTQPAELRVEGDPDPYTKADSVDCLEQQANAWRHVADALHAAFPQWHKLKDTGKEAAVEAIRLIAEKAAKYDAINTPEIDDFLTAVHNEALHQRERWGSEHDAGKTDADWFWLVGYLAGKAIGKGVTEEKQVHHIITTAAALLNWHAHKTGASTAMRPGIGPDAQPPKPAHFNEVTLNDGGAA